MPHENFPIDADNGKMNRDPSSTRHRKMTSRVTDREYEILAAFRYALRLFLRFSEDAAQAVGLTPQQHQALLAIRGYPGRQRITISELAERLQIRHHSAVGLLHRLESNGLIVRSGAAGPDRRHVFVSLTEKGAQLLEELSAAHREELRHVGPQLNLLLDHLSDSPSDREVVAER